MVVDKLHRKLPDLSEDAFWNEADVFLPYTFASLRTMKTIYAGSAIEDRYLFVFVCVCMYVCVCVIDNYLQVSHLQCVRVCVYVCVCVFVYVCVCVFVQPVRFCGF